MTRDWGCIREILLALEQKPDSHSLLAPKVVEGWDAETVSYHMWLLDQAGLIEAKCSIPPGSPVHCFALNLTWSGHELLDTLKNDSRWNQIRAFAREKAIDLTFEAVKLIASKTLEGLIGGTRP